MFKENPPNRFDRTIEKCVICLAEVTETKGKLACGHSCFCVECILNWSKSSNKCPICMRRFEEILDISRNSKHYVELKNLIKENERIFICCNNCKRFGLDEDMMVCSQCGIGLHLECSGMQWKPDLYEWMCDKCLIEVGGARANIIIRQMIQAGRILSNERTRLKKLRKTNTLQNS